MDTWVPTGMCMLGDGRCSETNDNLQGKPQLIPAVKCQEVKTLGLTYMGYENRKWKNKIMQ